MPNVLVVDDDLKLLKAVQIRLESIGCTVEIAQDGYNALAMSVRSLPDLIVMDVNLPAGNGFGVEERLRKLDDCRKIPVIYITGESPDAIEHMFLNSGAKRVLYKPFTSAELVDAVLDELDMLTSS